VHDGRSGGTTKRNRIENIEIERRSTVLQYCCAAV